VRFFFRLFSQFRMLSRGHPSSLFHDLVKKSLHLWNTCLENLSLRSCAYNASLIPYEYSRPVRIVYLIHICGCMFVCLSVCLSVGLSVFLSVCLSVLGVNQGGASSRNCSREFQSGEGGTLMVNLMRKLDFNSEVILSGGITKTRQEFPNKIQLAQKLLATEPTLNKRSLQLL